VPRLAHDNMVQDFDFQNFSRLRQVPCNQFQERWFRFFEGKGGGAFRGLRPCGFKSPFRRRKTFRQAPRALC
jgi:hypothetical protein